MLDVPEVLAILVWQNRSHARIRLRDNRPRSPGTARESLVPHHAKKNAANKHQAERPNSVDKIGIHGRLFHQREGPERRPSATINDKSSILLCYTCRPTLFRCRQLAEVSSLRDATNSCEPDSESSKYRAQSCGMLFDLHASQSSLQRTIPCLRVSVACRAESTESGCNECFGLKYKVDLDSMCSLNVTQLGRNARKNVVSL